MKRILALELVGGVVGGVVGGLLFGFIGAAVGLSFMESIVDSILPSILSQDMYVPTNLQAVFAGLIPMMLGAALGYPIGISVGVYRVGKLLGQKGSFWLTFLGAVLGPVLWFPYAALVLVATISIYEEVIWVLAIASPILAVLGFNRFFLRR